MTKTTPIEVCHVLPVNLPGGVSLQTYLERWGFGVPLDMNIERCGVTTRLNEARELQHGPHRLVLLHTQSYGRGGTYVRFDETVSRGVKPLMPLERLELHRAERFVPLVITTRSTDWLAVWSSSDGTADPTSSTYYVADRSGVISLYGGLWSCATTQTPEGEVRHHAWRGVPERKHAAVEFLDRLASHHPFVEEKWGPRRPQLWYYP